MTMGYLSVIKVHLRPSWSKVLLTDIKPLAVQEGLKGLNLSRKSKQNVKAAFYRVLEPAMFVGADARTAQSSKPC